MKKWICLLFLLLVLTGEARAAEVPEDLTDALPETAEDMLEIGDLSGPEGFSQGLAGIAERVSEEVKAVLRQRVRGRRPSCWWRWPAARWTASPGEPGRGKRPPFSPWPELWR